MPTSLDALKNPPAPAVSHTGCQEIYRHVTSCPVCSKIWSDKTGGGVINHSYIIWAILGLLLVTFFFTSG